MDYAAIFAFLKVSEQLVSVPKQAPGAEPEFQTVLSPISNLVTRGQINPTGFPFTSVDGMNLDHS